MEYWACYICGLVMETYLFFLLSFLVFGSEKRSSRMPVMVSCLTAAHNSLWVGTENGVILTFPFNRPTIVAEETGWEVIKVCICTCEEYVYSLFYAAKLKN